MSTPSSDELLVFIEPTVPGTRKLLKDVRALGGRTTDNIKLADCIVVDQFSKPGRQIIREWGNEKWVLEYTWIENSKIMKGRLITDELDRWLAVDDGSPLPTGADEDEYQARETRFQRCSKTDYKDYKQKEISSQRIKSSSTSSSSLDASSSSTMDWNSYRHPQTHFAFPMPPPYLQYAQPYMPLYTVNPCLGAPQGYPILAHNMAAGIYPYQAYNSPPVSQGTRPGFESPYARHRMVPSMLDPQDKKRRANSPPTSTARTGKKSRPDKVFIKSGVPLQFWVQVNVRLAPLRKAILANGGEISTDLQRADFAILDPFSSEFQSLLAARLDTDKPTVVPPAFVTESIACLTLQDAEDYDLSVLRDSVTVKQEKKLNKTCGKSPVKREKSSHAHYRGRAEPSHFHSHEKNANKHHHRVHVSMAKQERMRSPTPPHSAPVRSAKGWKYTKSERAYAIRYLQHKKGEKMNMAQLSDRLHKKIPHHSPISWQTYIGRKLRGHIANETCSDNSDSMSSTSCTSESSDDHSIDSDKPHPNLVQEDVETAANFFARCEVPSEAQDTSRRRYSRLSRHAQCRTASSWPEFMRNPANSKAVNKRFEEIWR